ncbi:MAG TPA: type II secretion system secretin GspD, partial [Polyangiaceae bacterium]|nr:type II secretion system secretin GspD [Polyangiaceae bacterium]
NLAELTNHISGLTGKRFIYGGKVRDIRATVVCPEPVTPDEAYQAFLSVLEANGLSVVPHGRFWEIVDSGGIVTQPTPIYEHGQLVPDSDRYVTQLYRLRHVEPSAVLALLNKLKSKDGDVTASAAGGLLIITDTGSQILRLTRIIEEVDVGNATARLWLEPVHHVSASELATHLNEVFELSAADAKAGTPAAALQRVIADERTNSLIIVGTDDAHQRAVQLLERLDLPDLEGGKVHVLALQQAGAPEMAATLTQLLSGQDSGNPSAARPLFDSQVRVSADKSTNSLIVTASSRDYATLRLLIDDLDHARRQVFIEAVIMDLSVSDSSELNAAFHVAMPGSSDNAVNLLGFHAADSLAFPADASLLQGYALGIRGAGIEGTEALLGTGQSVPSFGAVLSGLASSGRGNVLATPHVIATDNITAELNVGQNIALQNNVLSGLGSSVGTGSAVSGLLSAATSNSSGSSGNGRQDVGIKLKVTPHLNRTDEVRLEISQESSSAGAAVGQLGAVPINKRAANTTVVVADQQTVVIGGLMRNEETSTREKIPVLGDIPILGTLFRRTSTTNQKSNLLLFLTPHIIRDQRDLRRIFERKLQERQEFLDRYFVFDQDRQWQAPHDWTHANGLVEDIRQQQRQLKEEARRRHEAEPRTTDESHGEPIEMPAR